MHEDVGIGGRTAILRVARVQVEDSRARFRCTERVLGDLLRRDREVGRLRRNMHGAGDRARHNDF